MSKKELYPTSPIIYGHLFRLANGDYVRVYSVMEDDEYDYGYDYFDGKTKKLVDGGVFCDNYFINSEEVLEAALQIYGSDERGSVDFNLRR